MGIDPISISSGMRNSISALQTLSENIQKTQQRLASGKRVNSALDNPTNYFAAVNHLHRANDISSRKDGIAEGIQTIKGSENGITAITAVLYTMKAVATQGVAAADATERNNYAETYTTLRNQINTLAADSGYRGTNLLGKENLTMDFSEATGDSTLVIQGFDSSADGLGVGNKLTSGSGGIVASQSSSTAMSADPFTAVFAIGDVSQTTIDDTLAISFSNSAPQGANDAGQAFNIGGTYTTAVISNGTLTVNGTAGVAGSVTYHIDQLIPIIPRPAFAPFTQLSSVQQPPTTTSINISWGRPNYLERTFPTWTNPVNVLEVQVDGVKQQGNYSLTNDGIVFQTGSEPTAGQVVTFVKTDTWDTSESAAASLKQIDGALDILRSKSKSLSSTLSVATARLDFNSQMIDILNQGSDNLTLADMDMESANMLMLQTRQNLGITSLSMGAESQQAVMKLFI